MVRDKYAVRLAQEQREDLQRLIRVGKRPARVTARARILLKSDDGWPAPQVAEALDVALGTVYRVKQRFTEEGLAGVLKDRPQANRRRKLDDRGEAHLIALACSPPPAEHDHWTLRWLARCLCRVPAAPGGGGAPVGAAGPTGNPPVPLLRARQDEIPVVPGGHGGQPDPGGRQGRPANTGGGSSAGSALRAGTIRSAFDFVPARLGQILTLALLASASLPEYTSPNRGFRPDF